MMPLPAFEKLSGAIAVVCVASVIAVGELRPDLPQVACRKWLLTQHTGRLSAGRPAIDHDESHLVPPKSVQQMMQAQFKPRGASTAICDRFPDVPSIDRRTCLNRARCARNSAVSGQISPRRSGNAWWRCHEGAGRYCAFLPPLRLGWIVVVVVSCNRLVRLAERLRG